MGIGQGALEGMERLMQNFYKNKRVFITGHTGFKGSWLCKMLTKMGAQVTGFALEPNTEPNLFTLAGIENDITSVIGDVRNFNALKAAFDKAQPDIVFHLAAQPLVRDSYKNPMLTYETNVMGTVNILECVRQSSCAKSVVSSPQTRCMKTRNGTGLTVKMKIWTGMTPTPTQKAAANW